jgi:signal transduction histidine kinase
VIDPKNSQEDGRQAVLGLRWILIIATSYLLLFHRPLNATPPIVVFFIAAYLGSNVLAAKLLPRLRSRRAFEMGIVVFDATAVSVALLLSQDSPGDFFLLYIAVLLIGTLTDRLVLIVATATLLSALHLYTTARLVGIDHLATAGHLIRIPFLFVVALFFGHLVQRARSAEREAGDLRESERMRKDFVGGVIHDLKNPIGAIRGLAEMMLEDEGRSLTPEHANLARGIHAAAHRILSLSLNLLDAARIESGQLTLAREPIKLAEVVEKTLAAARMLSALKGVSVNFATNDPTPQIAEVDVVQMERVLWNLLDNAIRHTPAGGSVVVSLDRELTQVVLSVSDGGPGIPADQMPALFEQYKRAKRGHFGSTGLGLFVVKAIVEAHGGTVSVTKGTGGGARFVVRLPASTAGRTSLGRSTAAPSCEPRAGLKATA